MVLDFSQNYVLKYSTEIQSVHFGASKKQASLQTGVFYYKTSSGKIEHISFASFSDCLRHDASAIWALLAPVLELVLAHVPLLELIHFQSDGPSNQYKNKTNFFLFKKWCKNKKVKGTWNFTGAGHGKSGADSVGGFLKDFLDTLVACGKDVRSAKEMDDLSKENNIKTKTFVVTEEEIKSYDCLIPEKLKAVCQTKLIHQVIYKDDDLSFRYLTCTDCPGKCVHYGLKNSKLVVTDALVPENHEENVTDSSECSEDVPDLSSLECYEEGEWIVVVYDGKWFPGIIESINLARNVLKTKFLSREGKKMTWPLIPDIQEVVPTQVLCKIEPPHVISNTKTKTVLSVSPKEYKFINEAFKNCKIYEL